MFGTIPTTILSTAPTVDLPIIHDDTLLIPTISPIVPTIPSIAPTIQYTSPFICIDSSDSDTSERPPSQEPYEVTVARGRSRVAARLSTSSPPIRQILPALAGLPCRPVVLVLPGQLIPVGRPYRYAISDSPCDSPTAISVGPSCKRCRSLTSSVPVASLVHEALSPMRADLLPPRKRIRYSDSEINFEVSSEEDYVLYVPREIGLRVDAEDNYEPYIEPDIDLDVQADIDACILFC
ncbi:hypothetical protein Tco_1311937 [Tanacetum coccineum]